MAGNTNRTNRDSLGGREVSGRVVSGRTVPGRNAQGRTAASAGRSLSGNGGKDSDFSASVHSEKKTSGNGAAHASGNAPKKGFSGGLRKVARRTVAGVLMASAIIVAAIPARDTTAKITDTGVSESTTISNFSQDVGGGNLEYLAGIGENALNQQVVNNEVRDSENSRLIYYQGKTSDSNHGTAYLIEERGGQKVLSWQYQYFIDTFNDEQMAIIYRYNDNYSKTEDSPVTVPARLVTGYVVVDDENNEADRQDYQSFLSTYRSLRIAMMYDRTTTEGEARDKIKYAYDFNPDAYESDAAGYLSTDHDPDGIAQKIFENYLSEVISEYAGKIETLVGEYNEDYRKYRDAVTFLTTNGEDDKEEDSDEIKRQRREAKDIRDKWESDEGLEKSYSDQINNFSVEQNIVSSYLESQEGALLELFCDLNFVVGGNTYGTYVKNDWRGLLSRKGDSTWRRATLETIEDSSVTTNKTKYLLKITKGTIAENTEVAGKYTMDAQGYVRSDTVNCYGIGAFYVTASGGTVEASSATSNIRGAFEDVGNVKNIIIEKEVQKIGPYAFKDCEFLESVEMKGTSTVGARAFSGCTKLSRVVMADNTTSIGTEAFYGCSSLKYCATSEDIEKGIMIPGTVTAIRTGAFARCTSAEELSLEGLQKGCHIYDYAFFGCTSLSAPSMNTDEILSMGNAVFALSQMGGKEWGSVTLPNVTEAPRSYDGSASGSTVSYGDYMFYNRNLIREINVPGNYGGSSRAYLYDNFLGNCRGLKVLNFGTDGGRCSYVTFNGDKLFAGIQYEDDDRPFYVHGPETFTKTGDSSSIPDPRICTLGSTWGGSLRSGQTYVPYRFDRGGTSYFETQYGNFYLTADNDGTLINCDYASGVSGDAKLVIPEYVGLIKITALGPNCFGDDESEIKTKTTELVIQDGSLTSIGDEAFENFKNLRKATIGNSVGKIGDNVFSGCPQLVDIAFTHNTSQLLTDDDLGENVFKTGGQYLTIHGPITTNFAPYNYAMNPSNYV
ncbi:MAG: leucine-rich repeat protein, partial [Lachnospiraceae bacterium]|nr:leucine-rich repeat protein [Lachnospiraceae bacterium]